MSEPSNTEVAVVPAFEMEKPMTPLDMALVNTSPLFMTTMPDKSQEEKILLFNCFNGEHLPFKDILNTNVELLGWVIRPSEEKVSKEGEIYRYPITILILADGRLVRAGSTGVAQAIQQLSKIFGACPWKPPILVRAKSRSFGNNQTWNYLELPNEPSIGKGKK